jgi:serine/threonine-protein kinase
MAPDVVVCSSCGANAPTLESPARADGEVLDGHWRLERKLGKGGMGTVYLAHDLELDRQVAIKMLAPQYCDDPGLVQRFEREARMMAKLDHPNLVPVYSVGRTPKGPYIVMKLLAGMTLGEALKARGRMSVEEALLVTRQVAAGLQFIHDRDVVHRDIKPANIFVGPDGHATLLDLGVARDSSSELTRAGVLLGTPRYMSPEQISGEPADHRSDLYALATVVFEMMTGQPVFDANSDFSLMKAHLDQAPPDPSKLVEIPPALASALLKALSKNPGERFQSAKALSEVLDEAVGAPNVPRGPQSLLEVLAPTIPPRATPKPQPAPGAPDLPRFSQAPEVDGEREHGSGNMVLWAALAVLLVLSGGGVSYLFADGPAAEVVPQTARAASPIEKSARVEGAPVVEVAPQRDSVPSGDPPPRIEKAMPPTLADPPKEPGQGQAVQVEGGPSKSGSAKSGRGSERSAGRTTPKDPEKDSLERPPYGVVRCLVTANKVSSWAYVEVDGMRHGATPLVLKLEPGRHVLVFMRSGFKTQSREVMLAPGDDTKLLVEMAQ